MSWLAAARTVKEQHQARRVDVRTGYLVPDGRKRRGGVVLLDAVTAGMLVAVWTQLNERNRAMFVAMPILKAVDVGWRLVNRGT